MSDNTDLSLITRQQQIIIAQQNQQRDDIAVLMAIVQRMDGTLSGLVNEIRATHSQISRLDRRVRQLEPEV